MTVARNAHARSWRSSPVFITATVGVGFFCHLYLYSFIIPIIPYMLIERIQIDPANVQAVTSALLANYALVCLISSPVVGHFADKTSDRKTPLLVALAFELISAMIVAGTTNLIVLFIARTIGAISGMMLWIVGYSTLAENIEKRHMGTASGVVSGAVAAGVLAGPAVSGFFVEKVGYWFAWSLCFGLIIVNVALRLLMVESLVQPKRNRFNDSKTKYETSQISSSTYPPTAPDSLPPSENANINHPNNPIDENTSLLSSRSTPKYQQQSEVKDGIHFYIYIFRHRSFVTALYSYMFFSMLISAFEATLPLHVQEVFNWGAFPAGMLFVLLGAPGILLNPICGWLRDRLGTRHPTWIAFTLLAPFMWLLGCPGDARYPWANGEQAQKIYIASVVGIGTVSCMLSSVAAVETRFVVDRLEERHPGIFGPSGGFSRAYALCSMSWTLGMLLGPLLSGGLHQLIGYSDMESVLAALCLCSAVLAFFFLKRKA